MYRIWLLLSALLLLVILDQPGPAVPAPALTAVTR